MLDIMKNQCDNCGHTPSVEELKDGVCLVCGSKAVEKNSVFVKQQG